MSGRATYSREFFKHVETISLASAKVVVPEILKIFPARSVVDIGCGIGTWTRTFAECGTGAVIGIDGDYVARDQLLIQPSQFVTCDLNKPLGTQLPARQERFDLAVSLEVAEHLRVERAAGFVEDLCQIADVVLFGAAVPFQGGADHINEQWQSYWVAKFAEQGYQAFDVLRPVIWAMPEVSFFYKQNTIFYVKRDTPAQGHFLQRYPAPSEMMFDIVHPELFRGKVWRLKNGYPVQKLLNRMRSSGGVTRSTVLDTPIAGDEWISARKKID